MVPYACHIFLKQEMQRKTCGKPSCQIFRAPECLGVLRFLSPCVLLQAATVDGAMARVAREVAKQLQQSTAPSKYEAVPFKHYGCPLENYGRSLENYGLPPRVKINPTKPTESQPTVLKVHTTGGQLLSLLFFWGGGAFQNSERKGCPPPPPPIMLVGRRGL